VREISVCTGQAFGQKWANNIDSQIREVFSTTNLKPQIFRSPAIRGELLFKNGECDAFYATTVDFARVIKRADVFALPTPVLKVNVELLARPETNCESLESCFEDFRRGDIAATFRSHELVRYLSPVVGDRMIEVTAIEQGIEMLKKNRIKLFLMPTLDSVKAAEIEETAKVIETIKGINLYLWMDKKYASYYEAINEQIMQIRNETSIQPSNQ
jgi:hypothetical protein